MNVKTRFDLNLIHKIKSYLRLLGIHFAFCVLLSPLNHLKKVKHKSFPSEKFSCILCKVDPKETVESVFINIHTVYFMI